MNKPTLSSLILLLLCLIFLSNCKDKTDPCGTIVPPCDCLSFTLTDSLDQIILGNGNAYSYDSISISRGNDSILLSAETERNTMYFNYKDWDDQNPYSLKISASEQFPIRLFISRRTGECGEYLILDSLYFNNTRTTKEDGIYRFKIN